MKRLGNIPELPVYLPDSEVKQFSSYDRSGGNDDGFSGKYSFVRKNEKGHLVIFDASSSGVIERIWTPTPTDDTLDFYFEGAASPSFSIKFRDLFSGAVSPFVHPLAGSKVGGFYSYIPIPYKDGCKVVLRGEKLMFYQIQYRTLGAAYRVQSFSGKTTADEQKLLRRVAESWADEDPTDISWLTKKTACIENELKLEPGKTLSFASLAEGGRVVGVQISPSRLFEGAYKQVDLRITWDGEEQPAINLPIADFFGFAFGSRSMKSKLMGATDAKLYCYLPMPFDRSARFELVYRENKLLEGQPVLSLKTSVFYTAEKRNIKQEGKLYAFWNSSQPAPGEPHLFLEGNGAGHYMGTLLQSQATEFSHFTEFFEGDDKTLIDGAMAIHGTGSEDYFNGGWYAQPGGWVEKLGTALHGCLDYSLPFSRTGGYRFYLTDKIPFNKSIQHSIEHGPEQNNRKVWYTSVAFYYANRPVQINHPPQNETAIVFQPDTLTFYTRLMQHLTYNGNIHLRDGSAVSEGADNAAMNISVAELQKGKYKVFLHQVKESDGNVEVSLAAGREPSGWKKVPLKDQDCYLGEIEIYDPAIPVSILFKNSDRKSLRFNRVMLVPYK
ncbi:glycoside hydrolase family 172 protein [Niabella insulamsoli]|uniref:glycoside hydrolase family 172 protein n=1 Tax=Niabella insulamsoli TaxID=3144874 RepID=UPI0031FD4069